MKGFFSFILLLCIILILIEARIYSIKSESFPYNELISVERAYGIEMNLKEQFFEGARQGANEGFTLYLLSKEAGFDEEEAEFFVKMKIIEKTSNLGDMQLEDFKFRIWCGNVFDFELENLMKGMLLEKSAEICNGCAVAEGLNCFEYIEVDFMLEDMPGMGPSIHSISLGNRKGDFGVSIYSEKFKIAQAFKIPKKEVHLFEIRPIGS
ncbi:MAG: hypothetical protein WC501_04730 [Candidatus Micrarchaeia archaeon]